MSTPTNPTQTDQQRAAQRAAGSVVLWTGKWSSAAVMKDGACPAAVRAQAREGGKFAVREHCRSQPA